MTARKINLLEFGILPRGMKQDLAAAYVGVCVSKFAEGVKAGRYPQPNDEGVWDRQELDAYFDGRLNARQSDPFMERERATNGGS